MYNGNISETYWKTNNDNVQRMYGYAYDGLNRLTEAVSKNVDANITGAYNEVLTYDKNGNIQTLTRTGTEENELYNTSIDNLKYFYNTDNKNLLEKVVDLTHNPEGFKDDASAITVEDDTEDDYQYDNYGNMVSDQNKGITSITYNHLNLPKIITFEDGNSITYTYDAAGVKLKKEVYHEQQTTTTTYLSGVQYLDGVLQFFPTAEGYVEPTETGDYQYVYNYTDHLGNNRLSYTFDSQTSSLQIREENNYYPFGLKQKGYNDESINSGYQYKYNGKELQDELGLNMYDMDMRQYDPAIARWVVQDPITHFSKSTYTAFDNNPIFFIDPSGTTNVNSIQEAWDATPENGSTTWYPDGNGGYTDQEPDKKEGAQRTTFEWHINSGIQKEEYYHAGGVNGSKPGWYSEEEYAKIIAPLALSFAIEVYGYHPNHHGSYGFLENLDDFIAGRSFTDNYFSFLLDYGKKLKDYEERNDWMPQGYCRTDDFNSPIFYFAGSFKYLLSRDVFKGAGTFQFGLGENQIYHTFRHTDALGLDREIVSSAIKSHLKTVLKQIKTGKPFNQTIEIGGYKLQYTAFKLSNGKINIGRIHGIK